MTLASTREYNHDDIIMRNYSRRINKMLLHLDEYGDSPILIHNFSPYKINNQSAKLDNNLTNNAHK